MIAVDIAERALCARLSAILQPSFQRHSVHAEYNRHGIYPKEIKLPNANGILTGTRVFPDIIIHQPGHDDENILVIEVKKSTSVLPDEADLRKLEKIKEQIAYRFAVFSDCRREKGRRVRMCGSCGCEITLAGWALGDAPTRGRDAGSL